MIENLGPYRIEKMIGRGGMGTVYAAVHESDGTRAAIKVLSLVLADDGTFRERFIVEIETLKKLDHPNIVRLLGDGEQDGHLFYVMELVVGRSLQAELQASHEFGWQEVNEIAIDICSALKHAHDRGIIHRDLKPANLLRTSSNQIKLTDFGIAKLFGASDLTAAGSVVGTADYMAPEQAEGKAVSNRTDLYSLGSVMYTLLARRPPFAGSSVPQVVHKLRYQEPQSVRRFAPRVPPELEQIVAELLQKDPSQRISNATLLSKRLIAIRTSHAREAVSRANNATDTTSSRPDSNVSPTAVDSPIAPEGQEGFSWNDATIVTSGSDAGSPRFAASLDTVEEPCQPNRFTTLDEETRRLAAGAPAGDTASARRPAQTALLLAGLVVLIAGTVWMSWPSNAGRMYAEIQATASTRGASEAKRQIDRFLERFPDHPRFEEVQRLQRDVECDWLQSRLALLALRSGGSQLSDYEEQILSAMRMMPHDRRQAATMLRELLDRFGDQPDPSPSLQACLDAARHLLER
jgi:serine/threonine protein kinase